MEGSEEPKVRADGGMLLSIEMKPNALTQKYDVHIEAPQDLGQAWSLWKRLGDVLFVTARSEASEEPGPRIAVANPAEMGVFGSRRGPRRV